MTTTVTVIGGRATLRELRKADTTLYWKTINRMKSAAKPLANQVDANYPSEPPLSGFDHKGRTGWRQKKKTDVKVGGKRKRNGEWPLLRILVMDAPRMIFDLADSGSLGANLGARWGAPSRAAWRTGEQMRRDTGAAVEAAIREASGQINVKLRRIN